jgi:hypothetical protein
MALIMKALYDYTGNAGELTFQEHDLIEVISKTSNSEGWWIGRFRGEEGEFPNNYVEELADVIKSGGEGGETPKLLLRSSSGKGHASLSFKATNAGGLRSISIPDYREETDAKGKK